jgi:2-dehydro-3-deoxyphosphogluconate aldolase/(4S)-4-hydroxy-2-oxoglutarate aldolase
MTHWTASARLARADEILGRAPVLPVLSVASLEDAVPLARALVDNGLPVLEVTLRSAVALEAIARIVRDVPQAVVGAGTVLGAAQLAAVAGAGAAFAISPGASESLYEAAANSPIAWIPAVASASDIMRGLDHGHHRFKFFPAESSGGTAALKSFAGPFPQVKFCPTGGIDAASAPRYLALANVVTVGGSWMVPSEALQARDWTRIGELARSAAALARNA